MVATDHSEQQVFTYSRSPVFIVKDAFRVWKKITKIQDGRQRPFEQNKFLPKNPIINCNMSFVINLGT